MTHARRQSLLAWVDGCCGKACVGFRLQPLIHADLNLFIKPHNTTTSFTPPSGFFEHQWIEPRVSSSSGILGTLDCCQTTYVE